MLFFVLSRGMRPKRETISTRVALLAQSFEKPSSLGQFPFRRLKECEIAAAKLQDLHAHADH
jgi:hypothetical protein